MAKKDNPTGKESIWEFYEKHIGILQIFKILHFIVAKLDMLLRFIKNMESGKIFRVKERKPSLQDDRRIAKLHKADPFLTSTVIRG